MDDKKYKELLVKRFTDRTVTDEELEVFIKLINEGKLDTQLLEAMNKDMGITKADEINFLPPVKTYKLWPRLAGAAAIMFLLGIGVFYTLNRQKHKIITEDILPYTGMAILKSGGRTILLDSIKSGKIFQTNITKSHGEQLVYDKFFEPAGVIYDTIQIPKGGRPYTVTLSDGSKVILNAATTLRYPQRFSKNRHEQVELISGEIYVEVVHNAEAPLQVKTSGQVITDIGTIFNIAAYADEHDTRTTLVEGLAKINAAGKEKILSPGKQAIFTGSNLTVETANVSQATAWKDGLFRFNGERIEVVMRQLARWYNIEVDYEGKITDEVFYARVNRKRGINEVLNILERSQKVKFKVEGRRVTIWTKS